MFILLKEVKHQIPSITGVSSGAIASDYQRLRVESVCSRLGLISLAYLWKEDQSVLLQEMVNGVICMMILNLAPLLILFSLCDHPDKSWDCCYYCKGMNAGLH